MNTCTIILGFLAILEYVFGYDTVKFKRGDVNKLNLMESLLHLKSRLSCAKTCTGHVMCDGFYYCTEAYCSVTTCMLFTMNLDIGQHSTMLTNQQVSSSSCILYS